MSVIAQLKKRNKFQVLKRQTEIKNMEVLIFTAASLLWPYSLWFSQCFSMTEFLSCLSTILLSCQYYKLKSQTLPGFWIVLRNWCEGAHIHDLLSRPVLNCPWQPIRASLSSTFLLHSSYLKPSLLSSPSLAHDFSSLTLSMYLCLLFDRENRSHRKGNRPAPGHRTHRFLSQVHTSSPPCHLSYARGVSPPG